MFPLLLLVPQPFFQWLQPVSYTHLDVYKRQGKLYALAVTHLDVVAVFILTDALHHVGTSVVQGMLDVYKRQNIYKSVPS